MARSKESSTNPQILSDLNMALVNSDLLMSMINDILDYCQMKDHKLRLSLEKFSLNELIRQVSNLMQIQTELKGIDLFIKNKVGSLTLFSDMRRIKQILINLLSNAIKFTEQGFIKIIVSSNALEDKLIFSVEDTGPGIEDQVVERLGQPFATFGAGNNQNVGGIGLGLNLCKQLIGLLGPHNSFHVKTKIGIGTKFSFIIYSDMSQINNIAEDNFFDLIENCELQSGDVSSESEISEKEIIFSNYQFIKSNPFSQQSLIEENKLDSQLLQKEFTILIVDDNIFNLFVLENQLKKISDKWKILKANNGQQALDKFLCLNKEKNDDNISLIIMDCEMPIMNGYEASHNISQKIKTENYCLSLIIGYTALLGINEEQKCQKAGMNDTLLKPAVYDELKNKVLTHLSNVNKYQNFN